MTLHIIGGGGLGREVQSLLPAVPYTHWQMYDDDASLHYPSPQTIPEHSAVAVAMGDSRQRSTAVAKLRQPLYFPNLLHPRALLQNAQSIHFEHGTIITAGCILTCHITMGAFCFLNLNCTVGHDVVLGNYVSLMPAVNLGGNVTCEDEVYLGTGANILPGVHIGRRAIVGSGAVVTKNVPPNTTVAGVPARAL